MLAKYLFTNNAEGANDSAEAMEKGGLNWLAEMKPLTYTDDNGTSHISGKFANIRSDNGDMLGVVSGAYRNFQNGEAFSMLDDMAKVGGKLQYETAGALFNGRRTFMTARLDHTAILGDEIANYVFVGNSFDGSLPVCVGLTNVRIVCNNTLQLAIKSAPRIWKVRHTANVDGRIEEAARALGLIENYMTNLNAKAEALAAKKVDAVKIVRALFPDKGAKDSMTMKTIDKRRDMVLTIARTKDDLQNFRGNGWGLYQAVADYVSNADPERETKNWQDNRRAELLFGSDLLAKAQTLIEAA